MIRSASGYGSGRSRTALTMLKIAVFAPMPSARVAMATAENAGFLITCRRARRRLFIPKRDHWIDTGCSTRGNETGSGRNQSEHAGHCEINCRVKRVDLEQNISQRGGGNHSEEQGNAARAESESNRELPRALLHHHSENAGSVRAQRHANSKLLCPL